MERKLLVIEEDPFDWKIMTKIFADTYELEFLYNSERLDAVCAEFMPDVILFDMKAPDCDAIKRICSKNGVAHDIPVIVIVSDNTLELERCARESGVFYYMLRPFDFRELSQVLTDAFCYAVKADNVRQSAPLSGFVQAGEKR